MDLHPNNSWLIIKVMKELTIGLSSRMTGALLLKRAIKRLVQNISSGFMSMVINNYERF